MPDDLAATLAGIRAAAGNKNTATVLYGLERMVRKSSDGDGWIGEDYPVVAKVVDDLGKLLAAAPVLLAAIEAVLKLADDAVPVDRDYGGEPIWWNLTPDELREAITAELTGTGKEGSDE